MMRTGRVGYDCALAMREKAGRAAAPAARWKNSRRGSFTVGLLTNRSAARSAARAEFKIDFQNACPPTAQTLPLVGGTTAGPAGSSPTKLQRFPMCWKGLAAAHRMSASGSSPTSRTGSASVAGVTSSIGIGAPWHGPRATGSGQVAGSGASASSISAARGGPLASRAELSPAASAGAGRGILLSRARQARRARTPATAWW
jgi:hypothetical protein